MRIGNSVLMWKANWNWFRSNCIIFIAAFFPLLILSLLGILMIHSQHNLFQKPYFALYSVKQLNVLDELLNKTNHMLVLYRMNYYSFFFLLVTSGTGNLNDYFPSFHTFAEGMFICNIIHRNSCLQCKSVYLKMSIK